MSSLVPEFWTPYALSFILVLFRVAALVSLLPALGEASIPARVKLVMSVCMSLIVFPIVHDVSQNSSTELYVNSLDVGAASIDTFMQSIDSITSVIKGYVIKIKKFLHRIPISGRHKNLMSFFFHYRNKISKIMNT